MNDANFDGAVIGKFRKGLDETAACFVGLGEGERRAASSNDDDGAIGRWFRFYGGFGEAHTDAGSRVDRGSDETLWIDRGDGQRRQRSMAGGEDERGGEGWEGHFCCGEGLSDREEQGIVDRVGHEMAERVGWERSGGGSGVEIELANLSFATLGKRVLVGFARRRAGWYPIL